MNNLVLSMDRNCIELPPCTNIDPSGEVLLIIIMKYYDHVPRELIILLHKAYLDRFNLITEQLIQDFKLCCRSEWESCGKITNLKHFSKYFPVTGFQSKIPITKQQVDNCQILTYLRLKSIPFKNFLASKDITITHVNIHLTYTELLAAIIEFNVPAPTLDCSNYPEYLDEFVCIGTIHHIWTYTKSIGNKQLYVLINGNEVSKNTSQPSYIIPL